MANLKCIACNNTKSNQVESSLAGDALEMFNFVCCLDISEVVSVEVCSKNILLNKFLSLIKA